MPDQLEQVDEWLDWMSRVRRATTGTVSVYRVTMSAFVRWTGCDWSDVDATTIEAFLLRDRRDGKQAMPATQQRERATIASFYNYAVRRGLVTVDPSIDVPIVKVHNRQPKAVNDRTWMQLWSSAMPDEDRVWVGLGAFAGLRRREIVALAPSQFDVERGLIFGVSRKGGADDCVEYAEMARIVHERLPQVLPSLDAWLDAVRWLVDFRRGERTIVTHGLPATPYGAFRASLPDGDLPMPTVLNRRLKSLLVQARLKPDEFTPHALRHTCATNLLRAGVPIEVVADCLGHSSTQMTMRYSKTAGRLKEWRERM